MNRFHRRGLIAPVVAVTAVLFAACGSEDPSAEPVDSVDDTTADGMRSPTPIQAVDSGSSAGANATADRAAAPEMATDMMIAPAYIVTDYIVSPDLPPLPDNTTGYVFDASVAPTADQIGELAAVLGVEGEPTQIDDGYSVSWRVGPDDGSAPSVVLWDDAMLSWNYNSAWLDQPVMGCAVSGAEPGTAGVDVVAPDEVVTPKIEASIPEDPTSDATSSDDVPAATLLPDPGELPPVEECVTPEPPANVPTAAEAEALAADYLDALGVDVSSVTYDTWADEWSAGVTANTTYDGVVAQSWGFTFGGDAQLQYAWGNAATPEAVGPYTLVDLDTAVARLQDGSYGFGYGGRGDIAVMSDTGGVTEPAIASIDPAEEPPVDIREGEPLPEPMPVEPMPEPEEITVTLVDVQPDLWWVWDVDGSAWLVPAYRFIGDDGGWYTVPAVSDDFLVQSEPPTTEPAPDTVPVDPAPDTTVPVTPDSIVQYLGLSLDEFTAAVEADGLGPVRVAEIDGEPQALTMDLRPGRVNVSVETRDGVQYAVSATIEGEDIAVEPPPTTEPPATTVPTTITSPPADVVPIVGVYEDVAFYPACGTEILEHEGVTWYTLSGIEYPTTDPEHSKILALIGQADREESPVSSANGFALRIANPGPGDDVGTLVIWNDGVARFVSDSGDLDVWLVDDELTYNWVC